MDCAFEAKFGWKARSNSIFCSGSFHTAEGYGVYVYIIFPVGKYKILWSPKIKDLYANQQLKDALKKDFDVYKHINTDFNELSCDSEYKTNLKEAAIEIANLYKSGDLKKAIQSKNEIMINFKKYIGLKYIDYYPYIYKYITANQQKYSDDIFDRWYERFIGK